MAFYFKGYDNRGYYTHIPSDLAVVEGFVDSITVPWDVTVPNITYADFALLEPADIWASTSSNIITFLDMAVVGPVDDVALLGLVILANIDLTSTELLNVFGNATATVALTADFDVTEDDDFWDSTWAITLDLVLAATDYTDLFHGGAFVGYFFLPEQEIVYVSGENTVMRVPVDTLTTMRIKPRLDALERLPVDTTMITKKRNRSKVT